MVSDCRISDLFIAVASLYNYNSTSLFIKQFTCRNEPIIWDFFPSLPGVQTNLLKSRCSVWSSLVIPLRIGWIWNHSFAYLSSYQIANNKAEPFKFFNTLLCVETFKYCDWVNQTNVLRNFNFIQFRSYENVKNAKREIKCIWNKGTFFLLKEEGNNALTTQRRTAFIMTFFAMYKFISYLITSNQI